MKPTRVLVRGAIAGAVGTAAMDLVWFFRYRRGGGHEGLFAWETSESVGKWDDASAPGQIGRKVAHAVLGHDLPDEWARPITNLVHWSTGVGWGVQYALISELTGRINWRKGLAFGTVVWLTDYIVLPLAGVYKPIWQYDVKTLAKDLTAHLVYGATLGLSFAGFEPRMLIAARGHNRVGRPLAGWSATEDSNDKHLVLNPAYLQERNHDK